MEPRFTTSALSHRAGGFRKDIQGLRALAVLVVVAFHARLSIPGGFIGVDVFFVISGFVITSMLQREWDATGRIRLGKFYARRFKRLTPALALVSAVTVVICTFVLSPFGAQQTTAKTALGALLISANIVIAKTTGGYFDAPAAVNPLLHTWSLSVEEQFYLAFPLLVMAGWMTSVKWRRRAGARLATPTIVAVVATVSFGFACFALLRPPGAKTDWLIGYYGPLTRAWEFAAGALLVHVTTRVARASQHVATALGLGGVVLLALSAWFISEATPQPGPWTLLPVTGALLLLVAGTGPTTIVSRALAFGPLVTIGDWSYSIYLWHWPLIVFASLRWPDRGWVPVVAAIVSLVPALASYHWVESPLRRLPALTTIGLVRLIVVTLVPATVLAAAVLYAADNIWAPRLQSSNVTVALHGEVAWKDHDYRFGGFQPCTDSGLRMLVKKGPETRCQQSKPGPDVDMALLGDSHAEHLFIGLLEALPATNIMYFTVNAIPSKLDPQFNAALDYVIHTPSIKNVIVTTFWLRGVNERELIDVLATLVKSGKHVFTTDDVPNFDFDPFGCKVHTTGCSQDIAVFMRHYLPIYAKLIVITGQVQGVRLMRTAKYLCDKKACSMSIGNDILYADPTHLNVLGSRYVGRRMVAEYGKWFNEP